MTKEKEIEIETIPVKEEKFVLVDVTTQTTPLIQDTKHPEVFYNTMTALCKLMNDVEKIKEGIVGSE